MADRKISALTALTGANVDVAADILPILDMSVADASKNKSITVEELRKALVFPSFKAHKNGTDQTGIADNVATTVTFPTEAYDIGGFFASNAWTPPAGKVSMMAHIHWSGTVAADVDCKLFLLKDGTPVAQWNHASWTSQAGAEILYEDVCTGSNAYTVSAQLDVTSGTATILGSATLTYFCGHWFSA